MNYYLKIAEKMFRIETSEAFEIDESICHFFVDEKMVEEVSVRYKICIDRTFEPFDGKILFQKPDRVILSRDSKECRLYLIPELRMPYAYSMELDENCLEIHILDDFLQKRVVNIHFLELLALEKYLLSSNALVLHSSYIIYDGKAILFSAPSGTGKSTQASLWEKYRQARTINGDRSIFKVNEKEVQVYSLPFCGSSQINLDESAPLAGIVFLEQALENKIQQYTNAEAVKKIFSQCSINYWDTKQVEKAFEVIEELVKQVPVYHLRCTISEEAVDLVYKNCFFVEK